jgi:hypothetical protein
LRPLGRFGAQSDFAVIGAARNGNVASPINQRTKSEKGFEESSVAEEMLDLVFIRLVADIFKEVVPKL